MQPLFKAKKLGPRVWLMGFITKVSFLAMTGTLLDEDQPECDGSDGSTAFHAGALAAGRAEVGC